MGKKLTDDENEGKTEHIEKCLDEIDRLKTANAEQKAEIERLTEEHKKDTMLLYASGLACEQVKAENTKLQKQVEYWESETKIARRDIDEAVKDTAKEIYRKAEKKAYFKDGGHYDKDRYFLDMDNLKELVQDYGVEVE